jgi:hypothetical protein
MFLRKIRELLTREKIVIETDGELVNVFIRNSKLSLNYEAALWLGQKLRVHAKEAKRNAGDVSRHWSAMGIFDDLERG